MTSVSSGSGSNCGGRSGFGLLLVVSWSLSYFWLCLFLLVFVNVIVDDELFKVVVSSASERYEPITFESVTATATVGSFTRGLAGAGLSSCIGDTPSGENRGSVVRARLPNLRD